MFNELAFNFDVIKIAIIAIVILCVIRVVTAMLWSKWDSRGYDDFRPTMDKIFYSSAVPTGLKIEIETYEK